GASGSSQFGSVASVVLASIVKSCEVLIVQAWANSSGDSPSPNWISSFFVVAISGLRHVAVRGRVELRWNASDRLSFNQKDKASATGQVIGVAAVIDAFYTHPIDAMAIDRQIALMEAGANGARNALRFGKPNRTRPDIDLEEGG